MPGEFGRTIPPAVTTATGVRLLLQVPPVIPLLSVALEDIHTVPGPAIGSTDVVMDTIAVPAIADVHPVLLEARTEYVPAAGCGPNDDVKIGLPVAVPFL